MVNVLFMFSVYVNGNFENYDRQNGKLKYLYGKHNTQTLTETVIYAFFFFETFLFFIF